MNGNIAIITARGGSKRIPRKNIKPFFGEPIIAYSIRAALESRIFAEVMVSTDDVVIAEVAEKYGAAVPFLRSAANSSDEATTTAAVIEVLAEYKKRGKEFAWLCCLYPAAPFVTGELLRDAFERVKSSAAVGLMPVVRFPEPPQRALTITDNILRFCWEKYRQTRTQDLPPLYHDAGQFYFYRVDAALNGRTEPTMPYILDEAQVQDIDTPYDWQLAELKYKLWRQDI